MDKFLAGAGLFLALFAAPAVADILPTANLQIAPNGSQSSLPGSTFVGDGADTDPFISYGFSVFNFSSSPLLVSRHFSIPVNSGLWDSVVNSLSLSAIGGRSGFVISTAPGGALQSATFGPYNPASLQLGGGCAGGKYSAVSCYALTETTDVALRDSQMLDVYVNFWLIGAGSQATVSGRVELLKKELIEDEPVPEPGFYGAALPMLFGLALLYYRKRRLSGSRS